MSKWMDSYWESQLYGSGLTDRDIELWRERRKLDKECSVETEIAILRMFNVFIRTISFQWLLHRNKKSIG